MGKERVWSKKAVYGDIVFDSKLERDYYLHLLAMKATGKVKSIILQEKFIVFDGFKKFGKSFRPITYTPDFLVECTERGIFAVDVKTKGTETQQGTLRAKMFVARYDLPLVWITKKKGKWCPLKEWYAAIKKWSNDELDVVYNMNIEEFGGK